jgi:small subunit ribosomal protein S1
MRVEKRDDPRRPEQVSFSLKALERDPWQDAAGPWAVGAVVRGQVTRAEPFGAFVQLAPGVEGLLHISELGAGRPLRHAREAVKPGDAIDVAVLALEPDKRRISLGLAGRDQGLVDDEGRAAAARASGSGSGSGGGMGTLGDLLKGKLPGR